jgi:MFS family permease
MTKLCEPIAEAHLGPLSDIGGRKWVYVGSSMESTWVDPQFPLTPLLVFLYAVLNIGTALAYNLPMLIIFCFLIGVAGSTALNNVAGTIADLFAVGISLRFSGTASSCRILGR